MTYAWHKIGQVQHVRTEPAPIWEVIGAGFVPPAAQWAGAVVSRNAIAREGLNPLCQIHPMPHDTFWKLYIDCSLPPRT